ncbi:MAG: tRNA (guanosine(46)-N7)-methyltransferase TrmB [Catenulispora sp.]|nr:tRNA (guanosine(46)-N7)-methyltransferase TrmB [Catenulispora sp.]
MAGAAQPDRSQPPHPQPEHSQPQRHARHGLIRTFHPRRGRASTTQADALTRLWPVYGYTITDPHHTYHTPEVAPDGPFDPERLFGRRAPLVLEIGCGMGEATAEMAAADPDRDYLGVDVHTPGLGNLIALAEARGLTNVRVARGDVLFLLRDGVEPGSLAAVHVFFPDPWPKAKHHKRRIIQPDTVALIRDRLAPGGVLHCATDWAEYAAQMLEVLEADPGLRNRFPGTGTATATVPTPGYAPRDGVARPLTGYERRGLRDGRPIADLVFEKIAG